MPNTYYIGLGCSLHDPGIAIVDPKGAVVFAEAIERESQYKRAFGLPADGINHVDSLLSRYCDSADEVVVAKSWSADHRSRALRAQRSLERALSEEPEDAESMATRFVRGYHEYLGATNLRAVDQGGASLEFRLLERSLHRAGERRCSVTRKGYEHHLAHAAAGCYSSPFDEAVCAVVDGFGEDRAASFYRFERCRLSEIALPPGTASLGFFYGLLCWTCGFDPFRGEEWKVMGLAPYGRFDASLHALLRSIMHIQDGSLRIGSRYLKTIAQLMELRRSEDQSPLVAADLAFTGQRVFCELSRELLTHVHRLARSENLVLAGGCALNSSWNGELLASTPYARLHVPSAPADDGAALGAAFLAYGETHDIAPRSVALTPFLGSRARPTELEHAVQYSGIVPASLPPDALSAHVAKLLANGNIVGWFQGRAEYGPRALGNRSILADPRRAAMADRLNAEVKYRESFRPFAPSILHERGPEYFVDYQESPYMERTLRFREEVRQRVPAVVHVDGTGRLQSVKPDTNERYYQLIKAFDDLTGIPLLLNTSFNVMGKPLVHSVADAMAVFVTSGLDALVIEDTVFEKTRS